MASSPRWKVYDTNKTDGYRASFKDLEDAAAFVSILGDNCTIRDGHRKIVWTEGIDGQAGESYDYVVSWVNRHEKKPATIA